MPRKPTNQWEFGELFPAKELRQVLTVAELTGTVRRLLEDRVGTVWVRGEISNFRLQASGHAYFTLKDPESQVNCVLFRNDPVPNRALLDNGISLVVQGDLTVYEPRGQYQLVVRQLEFQGTGALQAAFERLKRELDAQGYFSLKRKRPLPRVTERVGLVTSPSGAAIRDVLHVIASRQPGLDIVLAACRVQGDGAALEIAEAIARLNAWSARQPQGRGLDLILVTRGGGSLEDLWAFNERAVAEAIFTSAVPIVSAVGHEIDFTISDLVADVRAATPSVAGELITEGAVSGRPLLAEARRSMARVVRNSVQTLGATLESHRLRLGRCRPGRLIRERMQWTDELRAQLDRRATRAAARCRQVLATTITRLRRLKPAARIGQHHSDVQDRRNALLRALRLGLQVRASELENVSNRLRLLSPDQVMARGYSITLDARGRIVRKASDVSVGDVLTTTVAEGKIRSRAIE